MNRESPEFNTRLLSPIMRAVLKQYISNLHNTDFDTSDLLADVKSLLDKIRQYQSDSLAMMCEWWDAAYKKIRHSNQHAPSEELKTVTSLIFGCCGVLLQFSQDSFYSYEIALELFSVDRNNNESEFRERIKTISDEFEGQTSLTEWLDAYLEAAPVEDPVMDDCPDKAESDLLPLCITLPKPIREILHKAEQTGIICYAPERMGYAVPSQSSKALVAYLCGRLFCQDSTDNLGTWISGKKFDEAKYCRSLFDYDVGGTRRSSMGSGKGSSPTGYHRVDQLFEN